ncbi:MAG: methylmalonyl-CoA mutase family protein [Bacteroidota bacterium]
MSDFYSDFSPVSREDWLKKVEKDLKGKSPGDVLESTHPIEEIAFSSYGMASTDAKHTQPDIPPFVRGKKHSSNNWINNLVSAESNAKTANKNMLHYLMNGADGLRIDLGKFSSNECDQLIKGIGFEYISTEFICRTKEQADWLLKTFDSTSAAIRVDNRQAIGLDQDFIQFERNHLVDAGEVQKAGGNIVQELAYALHTGHDVLYQLIHNNISVDKAAQSIYFRLGIGSNYFFETAKFRAFRTLWFTIVDAYNPKNEGSAKAFVEAETGFINKSLNDPHTNLLRQTTEALSAVIGGVDVLTVLPYNWYAADRDLTNTQRLALNIGSLLRDESYLDKVIDPGGGAYAVEALTKAIEDEAWELFKTLEKDGKSALQPRIDKTKGNRIDITQKKEVTLVGINNYFNPNPADIRWGTLPETQWGPMCILEQMMDNN